ncbi:hypothetical protein FS837_001926 [Tulasnella sp. UAMH 9824]|nr:hypothetical protein FS837_001926 [Tulasnella sp. UAMH 9824]
MAATTAGVPSATVGDLAMGNVPSICSLLSGKIPHGNFFAIPLDESRFQDAAPDSEFRLDPRIIHAWDWLMEQGTDYLKALIKPIGPIESIAFTEASIDIGIPADTWLKYIGHKMIPYYLGPLTKPAPLDTALHHARRARDHLLSLYSFISLIRRRTLGQNTIIRCPEDYLNWRFHALYCPTGIRPRIDASDRAEEMSPYPDIAPEEAATLARMQFQRVEDLIAQNERSQGSLEALKLRNAELSRELAEAISQRDSLQIELGRSLSAVKRTLSRARAAESYIAKHHNSNLTPRDPLPLSNENTDSSHSSHSSPFITPSTSRHSSADPMEIVDKN